MPPQHVEIAETVAALRRKLRRDREGTTSTSQPTQLATNRGNKLKPGVRFVHAGALGWKSGANGSGWTEKINHAGYERGILARNPRRYNEFGDELDDSDSDHEADADADEGNPYADVRLEEILRPLTHPSDLANHPALSLAYTDPALPDMVLATEAKIREERNNLWRAKNLYRYFTGDESWIPCGRVESDGDWDLFGPNMGEGPSKRRKVSVEPEAEVNGVHQEADGHVQAVDAVNGVNAAAQSVVNGTVEELRDRVNDQDEGDLPDAPAVQEANSETPQNHQHQIAKAQTNGVHKHEENGVKETQDHEMHDEPQQNGTDSKDAVKTEQNGDTEPASAQLEHASEAQPSTTELQNNTTTNNNEDPDADSSTSTPPPPPRRITRALAADLDTASNPQNPSPPPTAPSLSNADNDSATLASSPPSPSTFHPHPIFLLPSHLLSTHTPHRSHPLSLGLAHSGLPVDELLETRKLLGIFIQKSEETIRGLEGVLGKLVKAKRRRERVWAWCVAEGHRGEMSDGEDWIDETSWGLERGELRKGRDEDAAVGGVVETGAGNGDADDGGSLVGNNGGEAGSVFGGAAANHNGHGTTSLVMGGRKGKRRRGGGGAGGAGVGRGEDRRA